MKSKNVSKAKIAKQAATLFLISITSVSAQQATQQSQLSNNACYRARNGLLHQLQQTAESEFARIAADQFRRNHQQIETFLSQVRAGTLSRPHYNNESEDVRNILESEWNSNRTSLRTALEVYRLANDEAIRQNISPNGNPPTGAFAPMVNLLSMFAHWALEEPHGLREVVTECPSGATPDRFRTHCISGEALVNPISAASVMGGFGLLDFTNTQTIGGITQRDSDPRMPITYHAQNRTEISHYSLRHCVSIPTSQLSYVTNRTSFTARTPSEVGLSMICSRYDLRTGIWVDEPTVPAQYLMIGTSDSLAPQPLVNYVLAQHFDACDQRVDNGGGGGSGGSQGPIGDGGNGGGGGTPRYADHPRSLGSRTPQPIQASRHRSQPAETVSKPESVEPSAQLAQ